MRQTRWQKLLRSDSSCLFLISVESCTWASTDQAADDFVFFTAASCLDRRHSVTPEKESKSAYSPEIQERFGAGGSKHLRPPQGQQYYTYSHWRRRPDVYRCLWKGSDSTCKPGRHQCSCSRHRHSSRTDVNLWKGHHEKNVQKHMNNISLAISHDCTLD